MPHAALDAVVMPDGTIQLEWIESPQKPDNATDALQTSLFEQYSAEPDNWLLSLGFCRKLPRLSPSLSFWRTFVSLFTQKLRLTPDIEQRRDKVVIALDADELAEIAGRIPPMTGSE